MSKEPPKPWENDPNFRLIVQTIRGAGTGKGRERRIKSPEHLFEELAKYKVFFHEKLGFPIDGKIDLETGKFTPTKFKYGSYTIESFCHFLGVGTKSWELWRRDREDLKDAIRVIEEQFIDHRRRGGESGVFNAGLVAWDLEREERKKAALPPPPPSVNADLVANFEHPDMTEEQEEALLAAGVEIPMYTRQLIELGVPFTMPMLPEVEDD